MIKIKSGALYFSLTVSICFFAVVSAILLSFSLNQKVIARQKKFGRSIDLARDGIYYLTQTVNPNFIDSYNEFALYENSDETVLLKTFNWGRFLIGQSVALNPIKNDTLSYLIGENATSKFKNALFLSDKNKPLALCGKSKIQGNCLLPVAGVKRAYIEGRNFEFQSLISGKIENSLQKIPEFFSIITRKTPQNHTTSIGKLKNSFKTPTIFLQFENGAINDSLVGNIVINNIGLLTIESNAYIQDVIIYSDSILIKQNFWGSAQFFINHAVNLENNVNLIYPTIVELLNPNGENGIINIGENSNLAGLVYLHPSQQLKPTRLLIENNAKIHGGIINHGETCLKGQVYGFVYTDNFYLKTASSLYINHLLDGSIIFQIPEEFAMPISNNFFNPQGIKWLI